MLVATLADDGEDCAICLEKMQLSKCSRYVNYVLPFRSLIVNAVSTVSTRCVITVCQVFLEGQMKLSNAPIVVSLPREKSLN